MTHKGNSFKKTLVILLGVFILIVLGGRFIFNNTLPKDDRIKANDVFGTESATSTPSASSSSTFTSQAAEQKVAPATTTPRAPTCAETIQQDLKAKKQSFAKGQILVTFVPTKTYIEAKAVLSNYGLVVQNENDSQASYASRKLITAVVAPGQEIAKVCLLRNDANIKFAGLDLYFGLHE